MGHLTIQLGAALVAPIGTLSRKSADISGWKAKSLREASAIEAGMPIASHLNAQRLLRFAHAQNHAPQDCTGS